MILDEFQYLRISDSVNEDIIKLLEKNVIGTPGKSMLYAQTRVAEKLTALENASFANLYLKEKLVGIVCFLKRNVHNHGLTQEVLYVRYFTFLEQFRSTGTTDRKGKSNAIRKEVHRLMEGEGLDTKGSPTLYAYVDEENIRSRRLIEEFGFRKAGSFRTVPFARFFPKFHKNVRPAKQDEWPGILALLKEHYRAFSFVSFDLLTQPKNYFLMEEQGQPVCGVLPIPDSWRILSLPGLSGKAMMHLVPNIPILHRLFSPDYKFVFFEYTFCRPGYERHLASLFESVLAFYKRSSAILCLDPTSPLYAQIQQIPLGLSQRIMGEKEIEIVIKSSDAQLPVPPFYISGPDVL